ncbi:MAG: tetratricopeptide repeat protein, partial [Microbacteriaceae bacterium]|nr:tetratricopeptide repeat protein [Microbacteriaceae bacterium]
QVEDQPEVQARLWEALAAIHQSRSELPEQRQSLARGIAAAARAGDPDLALRLRRSLAVLTSRLEGVAAAESLLAANLAESERRYGPRDERVAGALMERAMGQVSDAERLTMLERSLAIRRALSPAGSVEVASSLNALSGHWSGEGDDERALELLREAEGMLRASQPADHPDVMQVRHNMAVTLGRLGRFEESLRIHAELLPVRRRVLGPQTTAVAASLMGMGQMLAQLGRHGAAADSLAAAQELLARTVGRHGHAARGAERALALEWARAGDPRADSCARSVFAYAEALPTGPSADVHVLRLRLWGLQSPAARGARLGEMRALLARVRGMYSAAPRSRFDALLEVGSVALEAGNAGEAESLFAAAVAISDTTIAAGHPAFASARCGLQAARLAQDRSDGDLAGLRRDWPRCRVWGGMPPALAAAVERTLSGR